MKSLFGYGITTKEIAKSGGWYIYDDKFTASQRDEYGNVLLNSSEFNPNLSFLEVTSPGIPPTHPLIKKAANLISEIDYYKTDNFQIWITGTNGKTTTTQMIHHLLPNSEIGGNIGIPLGRLNKTKPWVVEVSSFQLHYTKIAKPNIFVILPLSEDHISWHGSFEKYKEAKLSPLKRMNKRDIVIMPKELDTQTDAYKILYSNSQDLIKRFSFKKLSFKEPFLLDEVLAKTVHYILNLHEGDLSSFKIDPHKMEEITDSKNRLWVNDSKATNIDATINALKRYKDKKIFLILGGDGKAQDFEPLFEELKKYDIVLFLIGKDKNILKTLAKKHSIKHTVSHTLKEAINDINPHHSKNSVAILSPAAASLDQFSSYKQRGDEFKSQIRQL
ncbi:MAG: UDP-N-acetylmuramoyl-L-alanine--D-glutamate ligase [Epsilonproteobacteria bacterium]|nr:UDP-N-acetylmuramoyl-L-alanine--D-glutamate ligase [Campylobacterota bacterium]